ncbi:ABC transporter substrate-binding protein [Bradyrhizobium liaoningense]|uniref:ABC transporter substrate-binding protein n=1 Tax=Bradyrhizobium liaoningense TaxID=43992 RepID=UPI0020112345|nr:ABC transporter substrate-binding protein [Bradyrhizobium liaoningense]
MRGLLACTLLAAITSAAMTTATRAQVSDDAVRIGVLTDLSSWGRDNSGPGSVEAAKMAVEEFGPTVLGKPIEIISADHQMKTDVGVQIVRGWFDNGKVDAVVDIPNSGIAIAVHNMVRERNKIALLSGPGASSLTDELCSPNTVHFTYDTYALSKVTASAVIKEGGKSWYFITADYAFGQQLEKDATGRAFAAFLPEKTINAALESGLDRHGVGYNPKRAVKGAKVAEMLTEVRKHGLARALGDPLPGVNAFSAPVFDHAGHVALVITAMGPEGTFDARWDSPIAHALRDCAGGISKRLGYGMTIAAE